MVDCFASAPSPAQRQKMFLVFKLDLNKKEVELGHRRTEPRGLIITPHRQMIVADTRNNAIKIYDKGGSRSRSFGRECNVLITFPVAVACSWSARKFHVSFSALNSAFENSYWRKHLFSL